MLSGRKKVLSAFLLIVLMSQITLPFVVASTDPMDESKITGLEGLIERNILRAEEVSNYTMLRQRGEELGRRLHKVGTQREPVLVITGRK